MAAKSWGHLVEFLLGQTLHIPPAPDVWQGFAPQRFSPLPAAEWLRAAEAPVQAELEAAIDAWIATRAWPAKMRDSVRAHLRLRLATAARFLALLCLCGPHTETSWVPFPQDLPPIHTARWFLVDWWKAHGPDQAAETWALDRLS